MLDVIPAKAGIHFPFLSIFILLFLLSSCSAPSGPGGVGGPAGDESGGGILGGITSPGGSVPGTEGSGGGSAPGSESAPGSGGMSGPQASIPAPMAKKMLVANSDSNNYTPVIGFEGAVEDPTYRTSDYQVLVSEVPMVAEEDAPAVSAVSALHTPRSIFAHLLSPFGVNSPLWKRRVGGILKWFPSSLSSAFAQTSDGTDAPLPEDFNPPIWDRAGVVAHCPINADGSFECYPQVGDTELYVYLTDGRRVGEQITDRPNKNVLWLRKAPKDLAGDPSSDNIISLTQDIGVSIEDAGDEFIVSGNFEQNYQDSSIQGTTGAVEIASNPDTDQLALRVPDAMVQTFNSILADVGDGVAFATTNRTMVEANVGRIDADTLEYTILKRAGDNKLRFGRETIVATNKEWIFNAADTTTPSEKINFLDNDGSSMLCKRTVAFDVDGTYALVAFLDGVGNTRLRMGSNSGPAALRRFGGTTPLPGSYNIKDIQIYHSNMISADPGHALILDTLNNRVGIIDFNYKVSPAVLNISWPSNLEIGTGKNPESFVLNSAKTKAYVVNKGDNTLSVIDLANPTATLGSINLQTYLPGKELNIRPNEVAFNTSGNHLVIGAEGLKSALVIPVN